MLKNYQQTYGGSNASTANLKAIAEAVYGVNLDTFFNQWIYGQGYPLYRVSWDQTGSTVTVRLIQTRSCSSYNVHFYTPVELQLHGTSADTIVKVYNSLDTQVYTFSWTPNMSTVYLNPDVWTICKLNGVVTHDPLGTEIPLAERVKVSPNPTGNNWNVEELPQGTKLTLADMSGRIIWHGVSSKGSATIPGEHLPSGNYLLQLNDSNTDTIKLSHW